MSLVLHHLTRHSGAGQQLKINKPVSTASLVVLVCLGVAGGLGALGLVMQLYAPG